MEYIVRPFQQPASQGSILIPSTPSTTTDKAVLKWGAKATMPAVAPSGATITCCVNNQLEQTREYEDVQIQDQNNSSNSITVRRAKTLNLNQTHKNSCQDAWDQVAPDISSVFTSTVDANGNTIDGPADLMNLFQPDVTNPSEQCKVTIKLNNNTVAANPS